jgi:citrate synthase
MKVFWREEPLTETEQALLDACCEAHYQSSFRENISSFVLANAAVGSGSFFQSVAAALNTLGSLHGPVEAAYKVLTGETSAKAALHKGKRVAGWGTSFPDDIFWKPVADQLRTNFPAIANKIDLVTGFLVSSGKHIEPNPACYTAATALALGMPARLAPYVFLKGRLDAWAKIFNTALTIEKATL